MGFAAESENVLTYARIKRAKKNVPMLIANKVSDAMGKNHNQIIILDNERETVLPMMTKDDAAQAIVLRLAECLKIYQ